MYYHYFTRRLLCALMFAIGFIPMAYSAKKQVLFIGNSYTYAHNMPHLIQQFAQSTDDQLVYKSHTPAGATIAQHANNSRLTQLIQSKKWDFVTLQTQSQESAFPKPYFDNKVYPHVISLVQRIRTDSYHTTPLFFMTWGYEHGVPSRCAQLPDFCDFRQMNKKLQNRYLLYARDTQSMVVPAAVIWQVIRDNNSQVNLYENDGNHPSEIGVYANACAFYTMIFNKDPTAIKYNSPTIDDHIETRIKQIVKNLVFERRGNWDFTQTSPNN